MASKQKNMSRIRGTTPEIEAAARRLRQNMTTAETKLWQALKGKQLNGIELFDFAIKKYWMTYPPYWNAL
jgi:very-short-patch-repair endonuclease